MYIYANVYMSIYTSVSLCYNQSNPQYKKPSGDGAPPARPKSSELMDSRNSSTPDFQNLIPTLGPGADIVLSEADAIQAAADSALAPATRRAYRSLWNHFSGWCQERNYNSLPAAAVAQSAMAKLYAQGS